MFGVAPSDVEAAGPGEALAAADEGTSIQDAGVSWRHVRRWIAGSTVL